MSYSIISSMIKINYGLGKEYNIEEKYVVEKKHIIKKTYYTSKLLTDIFMSLNNEHFNNLGLTTKRKLKIVLKNLNTARLSLSSFLKLFKTI